jgi:hypothetical protein
LYQDIHDVHLHRSVKTGRENKEISGFFRMNSRLMEVKSQWNQTYFLLTSQKEPRRMVKSLPLGIQSFRKIRESDLIYVDKTKSIFDLVRTPSNYFISRPRRFGKSITLTLIQELFSGSKDLFSGLWIEPHWDWSKVLPVIHFSFKDINFEQLGLEASLLLRIQELAEELGIFTKANTARDQFRLLIKELGKTQKVVILIYENDAPITHFLGKDLKKAYENRDLLRGFYSVIKEMDAFIELAFIAGVTKFSKVGIFSGMNNLTDLTMHPAFATMLGYTQAEVESYFEDHLLILEQTLQLTRNELLKKMRWWYNGYRFDERAETVYNPISINSFMSFKKFKNFWFETGTPLFLIEMLKENGLYQFELSPQIEENFDGFDLESITPLGLLYQTGYLTIKNRNEYGLYELGYPNHEVENSMTGHLFEAFSGLRKGEGAPLVYHLEQYLRQQQLDKVIKVLQGLFKSIPYQLHEKYPEKFFHAAIHLLFSYMGMSVYSEVPGSDSRMDALVETDQNIFIFEFKLDESADAALDQIRKKNYYQAFWHKSKPVIGIGINLSSQLRNIEGWKSEEVE